MKILRTLPAKNVYLALDEIGEETLDLKVLKANTTDAATEKHVPVVEVNDRDVLVKVGSVLHPMLPEHYISFVIIETNMGQSIVKLQPGQEPAANFVLRKDEKLLAVYEYCNLHGLWKVEL